MKPILRAPFTDVVLAAVDAAATHARPGHTLDTRDVLIALMRVDTAGEWDRVALHFADAETVRRSPSTDPQPEPAALWGIVPVSGSCAKALHVAVVLAQQYGLGSVSAGIAAIGLTADPASAAFRALTNDAPDRRAELLELLADAILGTTLEDLNDALHPTATKPDTRRLGHRWSVRHTPGRHARTADAPTAEAPTADALTLLADALDGIDDNLRQHYRRMLLDGDAIREVAPLVADLAARDADEILAQARRRFDTLEPDPAQLIVAVLQDPCERVARALWLLGVEPRSVALEAALQDASAHRIDPGAFDSSFMLMMIDGGLSVAITILIGRHVIVGHDWWPGILLGLALLWLAWSGQLTGQLALAALLWWWLGPVPALLAVAMTAVTVVQAWSERTKMLYRTGLRVTEAQRRRHIRLVSRRSAGVVARQVSFRRRRRLATVTGGAE